MYKSDLTCFMRASHVLTEVRYIDIRLQLSDLKDWCIALMSARYVSPLVLLQNGFELTIKHFEGKSRGRTPTGYYFEANNRGRLEVDRHYFDNWLVFFLRVIDADGVFEAFYPDHFDMEFRVSKHEKKSKPMHLTMSWQS